MNGTTSERAALTATARLFGRLLIRELDEPTLVELRQPALTAALAAAGVAVPSGEPRVVLDALWADGQYESDTTAAVRGYAAQAGLAFQRETARGAPPDHLGAELLLWAEIAEPWPEGAARFVEQHLRWAVRPLRVLARERGVGGQFYAGLIAAVAEFLEQL